MKRTLHLTSPNMRGQDVRDAQWLLSGNNRWGVRWYQGKVDGQYGPQTAKASERAHFYLGYPAGFNGEQFGQQVFSYLVPLSHEAAKKLPIPYELRRRSRVKQQQAHSAIKTKALQLSLAEAKKGVTEDPAGSNDTPYGKEYGLDGEPWCAIFFSDMEINAGDKTIFKLGERTAWAYWIEDQARAGHPLLHITKDPEPGDGVVYHFGEGHIGRFVDWIDRAAGTFHAVEGNTSAAGSQDNGGAVLVKERSLNAGYTVVFVRIGQ